MKEITAIEIMNKLPDDVTQEVSAEFEKNPEQTEVTLLEELDPETLIVSRTFISRNQWEEWKSQK